MAKLICKVLALVVVGAAVWITFKCCKPAILPQLNPHEWWGPKELQSKQDTSLKPFKVKFDEAMISDVKNRLKNHRPLTPPLEGIGFEYGFNTKQLDSWLKYWANEYPFAEREKFLNQFPQFKTYIQGLDIHFIRVKPQVTEGVKSVPLLLMHGWPGSVREFYEAIPLLTRKTPGFDFVFEVIVPSLPGYGFSDAAVRPGLSAPHVANIFRLLMQRLGHKKFYIQGGDWGSTIGAAMATLFPNDVLGFHNNFPVAETPCGMIRTIIGAFIPSLIVEDHLADRLYPLSSIYAYLIEESGYFHLQATKPDTVGVALTDSPVGLLAYILEKFAVWTKKENKFKADGGIGVGISRDKLLDNLMIYWSTNSITTSMRFYAENLSSKARELNLGSFKTSVPTWALQAKNEIAYQPPAVLRTKYTNLLNATALDDGGHFIALEQPEVFVEDVFKAVKAFREWHKNTVKTEL